MCSRRYYRRFSSSTRQRHRQYKTSAGPRAPPRPSRPFLGQLPEASCSFSPLLWKVDEPILAQSAASAKPRTLALLDRGGGKRPPIAGHPDRSQRVFGFLPAPKPERESGPPRLDELRGAFDQGRYARGRVVDDPEVVGRIGEDGVARHDAVVCRGARPPFVPTIAR